MRIIMTGSTGFIGQHLMAYLVERKIGTVTSLNLRLELPAMLPDSDAIIHLAGKAHDLERSVDNDEYFRVNYEKTKQLFDIFLRSQCRIFIFFSSVKAVADTVQGRLLEDVIPDPKTPYGRSKLQAEEYISKQLLPEGKSVFILRPSMVHGPGNKGNLNLLYKVVKTGLPYPLAAFENARSFLSIANLQYIVEMIMKDHNITGGIYNIADDDPLSTNEVIRIIAKASGMKARLWRLNKKLIHGLANIGDNLHLPLNSERLKKLTESYVVSNQKIKNALNVNQLPVSSRDGLISTIHSFKD